LNAFENYARIQSVQIQEDMLDEQKIIQRAIEEISKEIGKKDNSLSASDALAAAQATLSREITSIINDAQDDDEELFSEPAFIAQCLSFMGIQRETAKDLAKIIAARIENYAGTD
jgi:argonaute-like protein implicated in RNA metabolism and viral defense